MKCDLFEEQRANNYSILMNVISIFFLIVLQIKKKTIPFKSSCDISIILDVSEGFSDKLEVFDRMIAKCRLQCSRFTQRTHNKH